MAMLLVVQIVESSRLKIDTLMRKVGNVLIYGLGLAVALQRLI